MGFVKKTVGSVLGTEQADAAKEAAETQALSGEKAIEAQQQAKDEALGFLENSDAQGYLSGEQAQGFLAPYAQLGQQGLNQAGFLTDPNQQFNFLQSNPLFQGALDNSNRQTLNLAAARGRLSAGDTQSALANNVLLAASPLINQQSANIQGLLNTGLGVAGSQANLSQGLQQSRANLAQGLQQSQANAALGTGSNIANLTTGIGAALAGGQVGAANARAAGTGNLLNLGATIFSDERLKKNIKKVGMQNGYNIYQWDWNDKAKKLGLTGSDKGVLAQEVIKTNPEAIVFKDGYMTVDYKAIGV